MVIGDGGSALPRFAIAFFKPNALISPLATLAHRVRSLQRSESTPITE